MEEAHPYILAVGGVVYRCTSQGQLEMLLIKKHGGFWTLPKGRIKSNENAIEAVQREVFEETGLAVAVEDQIQEVTYQIVKRGQPCHKVVTYYLVRAQAGTLRPDKREGIARLRWFAVPHALDRIHRDRVREVAHHASTLLQHITVEH
jgi:ADP-ribose pyrophosphatase YjhB (NUDIX family)